MEPRSVGIHLMHLDFGEKNSIGLDLSLGWVFYAKTMQLEETSQNFQA